MRNTSVKPKENHMLENEIKRGMCWLTIKSVCGLKTGMRY